MFWQRQQQKNGFIWNYNVALWRWLQYLERYRLAFASDISLIVKPLTQLFIDYPCSTLLLLKMTDILHGPFDHYRIWSHLPTIGRIGTNWYWSALSIFGYSSRIWTSQRGSSSFPAAWWRWRFLEGVHPALCRIIVWYSRRLSSWNVEDSTYSRLCFGGWWRRGWW